jgi:hypothetical protein
MISAFVEDMLAVAGVMPPPLPNPTDSRAEQIAVWVGDLEAAVAGIYFAAERAIDSRSVTPPEPPGRSS